MSTTWRNPPIRDRTPPTCAIAPTGPSPTHAGIVQFRAVFSEPVTGVAPDAFEVVPDGIAGASVLAASESVHGGYTITVNIGSGNGTLSLALSTPSTGSIMDAAGNPAQSDEPFGCFRDAAVLQGN